MDINESCDKRCWVCSDIECYERSETYDPDAAMEENIARQEDPPEVELGGNTSRPFEGDPCEEADCTECLERCPHKPSPLEGEVLAAMQPMSAALKAWKKLLADVDGLGAGPYAWSSNEDSIVLKPGPKVAYRCTEMVRLYTGNNTPHLRMGERFAHQLGFKPNANEGWEWVAALDELVVGQLKDRIIQLTAKLRLEK